MISFDKPGLIFWLALALVAFSSYPLLHAQVQEPAKKAQSEKLIKNGGFESNQFWQFETNTGARATLECSDEAKIVRTKAGDSPSCIMLSQLGLDLKTGQSYQLSLRIKAEKATEVLLRVSSSDKQLGDYMKPEDLNVTQAWQTVTIFFDMRNPSDSNGQLSLACGTNTGNLFVDDVQIESLDLTKNGPRSPATSIDGKAKINLLQNSTFDSELGWKLELLEGTVATAHFNGMGCVVRYKKGTKVWMTQLSQGMQLVPNFDYRVSFYVRADEQTEFQAVIFDPKKGSNPFSDYWIINAEKEWKLVSKEFTLADRGGPASMIFMMGTSEGRLCFDDVVVEPIRPTARWRDSTGIVTTLQEKILNLKQAKSMTKPQRIELKELQARLKLARAIGKEVASTSMTAFGVKEVQNQTYTSVGDSFIVAKIEIEADSAVAEFEYVIVKGDAKCTNLLYSHVAETSPEEYHDYRIVGRFSNPQLTKLALEEVRKQYDGQKKTQAEMFAYIKKRARKNPAGRKMGAKVSSAKRTGG